MIQSGAISAGRPGRRGLLADTHAHLDAAEFDGDRADVVARAGAAGVGRILAVGTDLASSRAAVALAAELEPVYAGVGVHPTEVHRWHSEAEAVRALLSSPKVVAVGEIGLDFVRARAGREEQLAAFRTQLEWAAERGLPVSVHNRGADEDVLGSLDEEAPSAVLHCFSGSEEFAHHALTKGCFLSLAGNVTFPRAEALRAVAALIPRDRLLIESDAPVLAPQPWRGRRNEPAYVRATAETVARARGESIDVLAAAVAQNADVLFHWGVG